MKLLLIIVIMILWIVLVNGYETLQNKEKELLRTEILLLNEKLKCKVMEAK